MHKLAIVAVLLAGAAGIGGYTYSQQHPDPKEQATRVCEEIVKAQLKSPTSYKRARSTLTDGLDRDHPSMNVILLTFDAANGFNAMIRGIAACTVSDAPGPFGVPHMMNVTIDGKKMDSRELSIFGPAAEGRVGRM